VQRGAPDAGAALRRLQQQRQALLEYTAVLGVLAAEVDATEGFRA
jgi:hypothetical protein